ncbi:MAG: amino acid permease, partial [Anaplasmataceae bacterium]|nr:amino acid permease [Anaplasmataceae bacterium]
MNKPIGFFALLSIVISSQLGAGTFILPANIHLYGYYGLIGCAGAALLAMLFAMIFSKLSIVIKDKDENKSGISLYINKTLGKDIGFFSGWVYWVICWASSVELVISANAFIEKFIGNSISPLIIEIIILTFFSAINLFGVQFTSKIEKYLNIIKILPLIILPIVLLLFYFKSDNIYIVEEVKNIAPSNMIFSSLLITFWGFIGLECATMTSREIKNKDKNVTRATIIGTFIMGILYSINILGVVGSAPSDKFYQSVTPF